MGLQIPRGPTAVRVVGQASQKALPSDEIKVVVWNVDKFSNPMSRTRLEHYASRSDLVFVQEDAWTFNFPRCSRPYS